MYASDTFLDIQTIASKNKGVSAKRKELLISSIEAVYMVMLIHILLLSQFIIDSGPIF